MGGRRSVGAAIAAGTASTERRPPVAGSRGGSTMSRFLPVSRLFWLLALFAFAACGDDSNGSPPAPTATATAQATSTATPAAPPPTSTSAPIATATSIPSPVPSDTARTTATTVPTATPTLSPTTMPTSPLRVGVAAVKLSPCGPNPDYDGPVTPSGVWGEAFTDTDGNGRWNSGEPFEDDPVNTALDPRSDKKYDGIF